MHLETITRIREVLRSAPNGVTAADIAAVINIPENVVKAALADMIGSELAISHISGDRTRYYRSHDFHWRKIHPILAGAPEYMVETHEKRLICWCPSEFDARIVLDALRRS